VALREVFASADGGLLLPQVRGCRVACRRSLTKPYEVIVSPCRPDWPPPQRCSLRGCRGRVLNPQEVCSDADAVRSFREFDRLAEQLVAGARTPRPFPMDAYRRGDETVVSFDLPGMAPARSTSPSSRTC
jgi:hypothetical protein